jgi:hypothetical protein
MAATAAEVAAGDLDDCPRDRVAKFRLGALRLALLLAVLLWQSSLWPQVVAPAWRWLLFVVVAGLGAAVNVHAVDSKGTALAVSLVLVGADLYASGDPVMALYVTKTVVPDAAAGKIDTPFMWSVVLLVVVAVTVLSAAVPAFWRSTAPLLPALCLHSLFQLVCEAGDRRLRAWAFFRHRYAYEVACAVVWAVTPLGSPATTAVELRLLFLDMGACLGYRLTNLGLLAAGLDRRGGQGQAKVHRG